jgi:hypothetical protein
MTTLPRITLTPNRRAYLHIWRTGESYARQKGALYRREWTNVLFSMLPQPADEPDICYHAVFELLDQLVREESGGLMNQACEREDFDLEFAMRRYGDVFDDFARPPSGRPGGATDKALLKSWRRSRHRR